MLFLDFGTLLLDSLAFFLKVTYEGKMTKFRKKIIFTVYDCCITTCLYGNSESRFTVPTA